MGRKSAVRTGSTAQEKPRPGADPALRAAVGQLAERAAHQDLVAFADLYRLYAPQVLRYVTTRVVNAEEAEDLTNTVFAKALAALGRYRPDPAQFSAWLYTIAQNTVIDYYRRRKLPGLEGPASDLESALDPREDPERQVLREEERKRLHQALMQLTPEQRQVIGCRFFFNLSVSEVARLMGKSEGAIKALQFRGLARLRHYLTSQEEVA